MIKTVLISFAVLSGVGTSAMAIDKVQPETIEFTAGTVKLSLDENGVSADIVTKSDYALRVKSKKGRIIAIGF